jgi:hypothetical protein
MRQRESTRERRLLEVNEIELAYPTYLCIYSIYCISNKSRDEEGAVIKQFSRNENRCKKPDSGSLAPAFDDASLFVVGTESTADAVAIIANTAAPLAAYFVAFSMPSHW